jgi:hypothetical protein
MRRVDFGRLARLMFGKVLWPIGALAVAGFGLALLMAGISQGSIDAAYGELAARGVIAGYEREHPGLAARLAGDPEYRRFLITSLSLYGLGAVVLLHQAVLAVVRRSRAVFVSGDMRRFRWLLLILVVFSLAIVTRLADPLNGKFDTVIGPGPTGQGHLALMFAGVVAWVAAWRGYLLVAGKLTGTLPAERWPTQPWMKQFPTQSVERG